MRWAWRAAEIRAAEQACLATLPPGTLMRRAAGALAARCARTLVDRYGGVYGARVLVLAGAGNNGGDALYAGAFLARRGAAVTALALDPDRVHQAGLAALRSVGGQLTGAVPESTELVIDGIVGIGGRGPLRPAAAEVAAAASRAAARDGGRAIIVAVDVPSGVEVDTGAVEGAAVRADLTVTFGALKPGLLVGPGAVHAGYVDLVDIGLGPGLRVDPSVAVPDAADIAAWWPRPGRGDDKYTRGVVGVAAGSSGYPGAALLAVAGALAGPTGMVRYAGAAADLVRASHPSVIVADRAGLAGRAQAWACGSGLGTDEWAVTELRAVLASDVPVCLDADAINLLVNGTQADLLRGRIAPLVLTPHDREFARLAGGPPGADRVEAALGLAAKTKAVILLKGDRTIVATPGGRAYVNPTGTPSLATAGTGDVLTGLLGSLLAAGLTAERAAVAAAFGHGLAGRLAAAAGPVTAVDVAGALRPVIRGILAGRPPR